MYGYDNYYKEMKNRGADIISIKVGTEEELETLKYWISNNFTKDEIGGIVSFGAGITDAHSITYSNIVNRWGNIANHVMTFVG